MTTTDGASSVTVVTGGASGIGEAICRLLVERGGRVLIADIQDDRGEALAKELGKAAIFRHVDVTKETDVAGAVDAAVARWGSLHGMVNNAGIVGAVGPLEDTLVEEWDFSIAVLLRSVMLGMKHASRVMKPARHGSIVSTSSIAGVMGGLASHAYATAKTAVIGLTRNAAAELGPYGIRANAVAPGKMATPLVAYVKTGDPDELARTREMLAAESPLAGRPGLPEDIAATTAWLLGDESGYISGQTIVVDGGLTSGTPPPGARAASLLSNLRRPLIREAGRTGL